jgi:hypothetical protein
VKRFISIGLLFLYLISSTEFSEVLRLPLLIEHYTEHKNKAEDLTFWQFLVVHYETDVAHDDTDMSLPFKGCDNSCFAQTVVLSTQKLVLIENPEKSILCYSSFYFLPKPQLLAGDIFQPPKLS